MAIRTYGPNAVDWEQRIDLDRLRSERLARLRAELERSELGALLTLRLRQHPLHDLDPHRHLGDGQADPVRGAAARRRAGRCGTSARRPGTTSSTTRGWTTADRQPEGAADRRRAGISTLRGAFHPDAGHRRGRGRARSPTVLREHGLAGEPVGVDVVEMPVLAALQAEGIEVVDGQQVFLEARRIKTARRDLAADPGLLDGRRGLRRSCTSSCGRACGRTSASAWSARCSTTWAASTSRGSTRSRASAARRTRTSTATG